MKIKSFKVFENEEMVKTSQSFTSSQHKDFCEACYNWSEENKQPIAWCLYGSPKSSPNDGYNTVWKMDSAKKFWDMYVKGDKTFTIAEADGKLIGILHKGDQVEMAFDNNDFKFDLNKAKELI
jgi:hypothetical protein